MIHVGWSGKNCCAKKLNLYLELVSPIVLVQLSVFTSHHVWTGSNFAGSALSQDFRRACCIIEFWTPSPIRLAKPRIVRPGLEPVMADGDWVWWLDPPPSDQNPSYKNTWCFKIYMQKSRLWKPSSLKTFLKNAFENECATDRSYKCFFLCCAIPMAPRIAVKTTSWPNVSMASPSGKTIISN